MSETDGFLFGGDDKMTKNDDFSLKMTTFSRIFLWVFLEFF